MVQRDALVDYLDELLEADLYQDYAPNGLQVEGRDEIGRIVCGVTASQALIEAAVEHQADAVLVHHGYFWKGEAQPIIGIKQQRIATLLKHGINLIAYHLPLDGHPLYGNNAQLAKLFDWPQSGRFGSGPNGGLGVYGDLDGVVSLDTVAADIARLLEREPQVIEAGSRPIQRVAWCSGGAQGYLEQAAAIGADLYVSGEISEPTFHLAQELGVHYIAAGHHATERYGVRALGEHLAQQFELQQQFVDIFNPV